MLSPKEFLLQSNSFYVKPGVYTVLPSYKKGVFDIPFHINRLYNSYNLLQDNKQESMRYKDFEECVMKSLIKSKEKYDTSEYGIYTISMGKKKDIDHIEILTMYSDRSATINNKVNDQLQCYIDFAECKRHPVQAKYISWIHERSILESNRLVFINETILYQQNNILNENSNKFSCKLITEGLTSNIFIIDKYNQVLTCPDSMILPGSISKLIKTICKFYNIPLIETIIDLNDIHNWQGMFLTNSVKNIQNIDGFYIDNNDLIVTYPTSMQYTTLDKFNEYNIHKFNLDSKRNSNKIINLIKDTLFSYLFTDEHIEIDDFIESIYEYSPWKII